MICPALVYTVSSLLQEFIVKDEVPVTIPATLFRRARFQTYTNTRIGYFKVPIPPISRISVVFTPLVASMRSNHRILKTTITCCRARVDSTSGSPILGEKGQIFWQVLTTVSCIYERQAT